MRKLKIQKLIEKYGLDELDSELERQYITEDKSLRDLADHINILIARQFFEDEPFSGEYVYRALNDPADISKQEQTDLRKRLREEDIPIEELERDWVGHMPVKSYLNRVLDIDTSRERTTRSPEKALSDIRRTVDYQESVIREILVGVEGVDLANWDLHTDHRLIKSDTGESIRLERYLQDLDDNS
jgi:hypothetical protein